MSDLRVVRIAVMQFTKDLGWSGAKLFVCDDENVISHEITANYYGRQLVIGKILRL